MARTKRNKSETVTFLLPGTAAFAIDLDGLAEQHPDLTVEPRLARYGMSHVVTTSPATARTIAEKVAERAKPNLGRGNGQPSSWGHGCRKALPRIRKALAGAGK